MNVAEIEMQLKDLVDQPFDQAEFFFSFAAIFNPPKATLTKLRNKVDGKLGLEVDLSWPRKLHYRPATPGNTGEVVAALKAKYDGKKNKPRFLLSTDGNEVSAYDTKADDPVHCDYGKLNDEFDFFLPLAGIDKYEAVEENPADIKAAGRLAKLHDEIVRVNPDWASPEKRHALNLFMTRVLFSLFAEDTSFNEKHFVKVVTELGGEEGEHLQDILKYVFDAMDVPEKERTGFPAYVNAFPYVNGGLFAERSDVPSFSKRAKRILIEAAELDWKEINPDIFGSMIQAVVDPEMRGDLGMHYTSVPNIMKVLQPLFLMSLEEEFDAARGHREERSMMRKLLTRISKIRVFDPACGSGNFLIIGYRELRKLEMRIFERLDIIEGGTATWRGESGVSLSNFYGIELAEFAAETAKLSLWIAEYQMNQQFKETFGSAPPNFPIQSGGHIVCDNALRVDWLDVCPLPVKTAQRQKAMDLATVVPVRSTEQVPVKEVETYIVGNPPYLGGKLQNPSQKEDLERAFSGWDLNTKNFDYVSGWFAKATRYLMKLPGTYFSFVCTNSLNQGIHASSLWKSIFDTGVEIFFSFKDFKWANSAAHNANVICSIIGVRRVTPAQPKYLMTDDSKLSVPNINSYLLAAPNYYIRKHSESVSLLPKMYHGNTALEGGNLLLSPQEKAKLLELDPELEDCIRPVVGSREYINGISRWCLWLDDTEFQRFSGNHEVAARVKRVREARLAGGTTAVSCADRPHQFFLRRTGQGSTLVIPAVSSERRQYIPAGFVDSNTIVTHLAYMVLDAPAYLMSVIVSRMHVVWLRMVGGRMKTDFRYSNTIVYNSFPTPTFNEEQKDLLESLAWQVIAARESNPGKSLAWLYSQDQMPLDLRHAHLALDEALEKIYIGRSFKNDAERLKNMFELYTELTADAEKGKVANA